MMNFDIAQVEEHEDNLDFLDMLTETEDFSKELEKCGLDFNYQELDSKTMIDLMSDSI